MKTATTQHLDQDVKTVSIALQENHYPPLEQETRVTVPTKTAAYHLSRKDQTLRAWACLENGPIRPIRINGRLAWRVADLRALLEGGNS